MKRRVPSEWVDLVLIISRAMHPYFRLLQRLQQSVNFNKAAFLGKMNAFVSVSNDTVIFPKLSICSDNLFRKDERLTRFVS